MFSAVAVDTREVHADPDSQAMARVTAQVEAIGYTRQNRVEASGELVHRLGFVSPWLALCRAVGGAMPPCSPRG
jgi:hypothetical protein